jgi:TRAP-type transport system periplasmic protein
MWRTARKMLCRPLPWGNIDEVQKYLTLDRHVYSNHIFPVNEKWYNALPPVYQLIIQQEALKARQTATRMTRIRRETLLARFRKEGIQIYDPSPAELALFRAKAQKPVLKFIREQVGGDLVNALLLAALCPGITLTVLRMLGLI